MVFGRCLAIALLAVTSAPLVSAQDPTSFASRGEYLLRRIDSGLLPTPMLIAMLADPFSETRVFAARAAASSSDPSQTLLLWEYARDRDFRVRYEIMLAAGRLGEGGSELAFEGLGDGVPRVRQAAAWAACHGGPDAFHPLVEHLKTETDLGVRSTALANLWRFGAVGWEAYAAAAATHAEAQVRRAAAYSLGRSGRPAAREALRGLAADSEAVIRATATAGLARIELEDADLAVLTEALGDPDHRVRVAACSALAAQPEPALTGPAGLAISAMWSPTDPQLAVMAIRTAGARPEIGDDAGLLELATSEEPWLAAEALAALVRRNADRVAAVTGRPDDPEGSTGKDKHETRLIKDLLGLVDEWAQDDELWRRRAVAAVAPALGSEWEERSATDPAAAVRLAWLETLDAEAVSARLQRLEDIVSSDTDVMVRAAAVNHLSAAGAAGSVERLLDLYLSWGGDEAADARAAVLSAALALDLAEEQQQRVLELAYDDPNPAVGILVANTARSLDLPARSPEREARHNRTWYLELVDWMRDRHWLEITTDRGSLVVRLESFETPITTREVYELSQAGFYDGLTFHRVVPNFVVQGGDPRGDGWGGAGFVLPDEPAFRPFDTGRVGIATAGPNTGGGQLFFTLMPADHLVGHYTNLGEVVSGREVLSRLRVGDRIRRIEVFSGDEPAPPDPVLLGRLEWGDLEEIPGWLDEYQAANPDSAALERLALAAGSYRIVTVLGTWCSDSRREVPRLARILDELEAPVFDHLLVGVDRTRRIDEAALAADAGIERTVERVATMIVFDAEGIELGRIVETADRPIEALLVEFLAPAEGW